MFNSKKLLLKLNKILKDNLESVVIFGSYARGDNKINSDIDILIITNSLVNENELQDKISKIDSKIELLILSKEEFKNRVLNFNHQLLSLFMDGKIIYDKNKFYYKMENLYLALNRKKEFKLVFRNKILTLNKLMKLKNFI